MHIRILMIGNDRAYINAEQAYLKEKGYRVYITDPSLIAEMVQETNPDIVFLNFQAPSGETLEIYHQTLELLRLREIPVVFTLSEDTAYLVNRNSSRPSNHIHFVSDNLSDAFKQALTVPRPKSMSSVLSFRDEIHHALSVSA